MEPGRDAGHEGLDTDVAWCRAQSLEPGVEIEQPGQFAPALGVDEPATACFQLATRVVIGQVQQHYALINGHRPAPKKARLDVRVGGQADPAILGLQRAIVRVEQADIAGWDRPGASA